MLTKLTNFLFYFVYVTYQGTFVASKKKTSAKLIFMLILNLHVHRPKVLEKTGTKWLNIHPYCKKDKEAPGKGERQSI